AATRTVLPKEPDQPIEQWTESITTNGNTATTTYLASTRTKTMLSAAGRRVDETYDDVGRITRLARSGIQALDFSYDALGRVIATSQGSRGEIRTYDTLGRLDSTTDALSRVMRWKYDDASRMLSEQLPDGKNVGYDYDLNGNLRHVITPMHMV